ncbi:MAG TPA: sigma-70 family RNA polymerase sigma factor [Gemmatimonadaceae bacterium]|nr:sigma-70 family RNA polymerase sigma factor [Gemmatimonadaceae bacterium]
MSDLDSLASRFEGERGQLRAVAYRMLGSLSEAEDAVQEAWLRLSRSDASAIDNLSAWLTTTVSRICLDLLRARAARREEAFDASGPEPVVGRNDSFDAEHETLLAESVGLAMLVVLDALEPAERVAFVLHDMFDVPFGEIASILSRTPGATRQLASRARKRVRGGGTRPDADRGRQRLVMEAYLAASRQGDFDALLALLDPDVVLRVDRAGLRPGEPREVRGAAAVVGRALANRNRAFAAQLALIDGDVGILVGARGRLALAFRPTISGGHIVEIDIVADAGRLRGLEIRVLD